MTNPLDAHASRRVPDIAVLVTWSLTVIGAVWAASAERADILHELREQQKVAVDHEARLRALEKQANEVAADVRWIRQMIEKNKPWAEAGSIQLDAEYDQLKGSVLTDQAPPRR